MVEGTIGGIRSQWLRNSPNMRPKGVSRENCKGDEVNSKKKKCKFISKTLITSEVDSN